MSAAYTYDQVADAARSLSPRAGHKMILACAIVARNPGCPKWTPAARCMINSRGDRMNNGFGYDPVNRAIAQGLLVARNLGWKYSLTLSPAMVAAIEAQAVQQ